MKPPAAIMWQKTSAIDKVAGDLALFGSVKHSHWSFDQHAARKSSRTRAHRTFLAKLSDEQLEQHLTRGSTSTRTRVPAPSLAQCQSLLDELDAL
jgi:hypothetical protein